MLSHLHNDVIGLIIQPSDRNKGSSLERFGNRVPQSEDFDDEGWAVVMTRRALRTIVNFVAETAGFVVYQAC